MIDFINIREFGEILVLLIGFIIITISSNHISKVILKIKLPLITGFLIFGIFAGPFGLKLISKNAVDNLHFVNEISLAFIAFAAGSELYIKELRKNFSSIAWNTLGQFVVTFVLGSVTVYFITDLIPFVKHFTNSGKIIVSILIATIFVASSPSSAIAIIDEMRAKGPFTQSAIGITVIKDVLVIVLFSLCFSIANILIKGEDGVNYTLAIILLIELILSAGIGYSIGKLISFLIGFSMSEWIKTILILFLGYCVYLLSHYLSYYSKTFFSTTIHIEPLLSCIIASFYVINFCKNRFEFQKIIQDTGPFIYVAFFTLTGAMISLDILVKSWFVAVILFIIRFFALIIGAYFGSTLAKDPKQFKRIGWMPFVTQAGVSIALITEISDGFISWGNEFATIMISVIVMNQLVGPPLFKWAINKVGESNLRAKLKPVDKTHTAVIFGLDYQSIALARELTKHLWKVKIVTSHTPNDEFITQDFDVLFVNDFKLDSILGLNLSNIHATIFMLTDEENYDLCKIIYKHVSVKEIIVRLQDHSYMSKFRKLGVTIIEPATAVVSLIDHFVRAPLGTSILFGMDSNYDTIDIEIQDKKMHGTSLRDLRLPSDVLILSVNRKGQSLISHGYTRLRLGDIVTLFGSPESLEKLHLRFEIN